MKYAIAALALMAGYVVAQEIPEEPILIEAELHLTNGSAFTCLFRGEVSIDGQTGLVRVSGCPTGEIVCDTLIFAEINTFAPFIEASGCAFQLVSRDGFEATMSQEKP
jgi:hypothetical protein